MNELKVGLLVLVAMAAVVFMSFKITSNQSGFANHTEYKTIVTDASGIFPKTPIKVAGIVAGRISSIELENNKASITFQVLSRIKVTKGSKLKIKTVGFLGDKYLEVALAEGGEFLVAGDYIESEEGAGIEKLMKDAGEVVADIKKVTGKIKDTFAPEGQEAPLDKIMKDFKQISQNASDVTASLKRIVNGNEEKLNALIANLEKFSEQVKAETDRHNDQSLVTGLNQILDNTKSATNDLKQILADVRAGRGTIGKFLVEDEIADKVSTTLSSLNRMVQRFNSIRTEVQVFTGGNTDYGADTRGQIRIWPSPERFYLLGLSTSEFGPDNTRLTTTTAGGVTSERVETYRDKDEFRFDIQMARRMQNWIFRGGLIESTGGIGVEYLMNKWGTTFTGELFDYRSGVGPNLRVSTEFRLWNVFFAKIMGEDLTVSSTRSATGLVGVKFSDEDMRNLLALFF